MLAHIPTQAAAWLLDDGLLVAAAAGRIGGDMDGGDWGYKTDETSGGCSLLLLVMSLALFSAANQL